MNSHYPPRTFSLSILAATLVAALAGAIASSATAIAAEPTAGEWPRFRGPGGLGESEAAGVPATWGENEWKWRVTLPGVGHGSPVVSKGHIYLTAVDEETGVRQLLCLKASDGSTVWQRAIDAKPHAKHALNSHAAMTPPVDDERVFVTGASAEGYFAAAFRRGDGRELWLRDLGPWVGEHGPGASPIVVDGLLIVPNDQDGVSFVAALECVTGGTRWQIDRPSAKTSYATPIVFQPPGGAAQVILASMASGVTSLDPRTGAKNWELPVFKERTVGSPTLAGGLIVATSGEGSGGKRVVAIDPGDPATKREAKLAYDFQGSLPYVPVPVARGSLVFLWNDAGVVTCCETASGKVVWRQRVGGKYFASPIRVQDRLYCPSRDGEMVVLAAKDVYEHLGSSPIGEGTHATPAVVDGVMYVRTFTHLLAVGGTGKRD